MRTYDLTPFYRSTVGFDRLFSLLDQATTDGSPGYPPYNIERTGENAYRITVAASGFTQAELSVVAKYAFALAQQFNGFYHRFPILAEDRKDVRLWRAAAVAFYRDQMTEALGLMGCAVPERM